ncbi:MAG: RluA family pseudouridine synthase [Flavisolibacter sp.]|nr:RluA family pseudouridine synthase [Flavisolibacter sp.]
MKIEEQIIYSDEDLIAVNKPSGLLSIPDREGKGNSLKEILLRTYGEIYTVHRLDRDTSGIVVFAKNEKMHRHLSLLFEKRETQKFYHGLVLGVPPVDAGTINEPIAEHPFKKGLMTVHRKGKESITDYQVENSFRIFSWMRFQIHTGRTHQIRVHMKHLGHPIACDASYGEGKPVFISQIKSRYKLSKEEEEERPVLNRLALHASELSFMGPGNKPYRFEAPLPKDLKAILQQLSKWIKTGTDQRSMPE